MTFSAPSVAANDPLKALDFLIGTWHGAAPEASGTDVFQRDLDGHVLQRRSQNPTTSSAGITPQAIQALLTIYPLGEGDALAAIYFDNEGHVIHYEHVAVTPRERVEFRCNGGAATPGFRLTYSLRSRGTLHVKFEMAPPGQSSYRVVAEADETATR